MRTVEHQHGRARRLILALMHLEIAIFNVQWDLKPFPLNRVRQGSRDVEIQCVAKFVALGCTTGFDAGRGIARVVATEA